MTQQVLGHYVIAVRAVGLRTLVTLNGALVVQDVNGAGVSLSKEVSEWIVPPAPDAEAVSGEDGRSGLGNRLRVSLAELDPAVSGAMARRVDVALRLQRPDSEDLKGGQSIFEFSWPFSGVPSTLPLGMVVPFDVRYVPPVRLWAEAAVLPALTEADKDAILEVVEELRVNLLGGDTDPMRAYELTSYKVRDLALAHGMSPGRARGLAVVEYALMEDFLEPVSEPLGRPEATFERVANDQLVRVSRGAMAPAIQIGEGGGGGQNVSMEIYVARIGGRWVIAR